MLETLQHPGFLFEPLALRLGQFTVLQTGRRGTISREHAKRRKTKHCTFETFREDTHPPNQTHSTIILNAITIKREGVGKVK